MKKFILLLAVCVAVTALYAGKTFSEAGWLWAGDQKEIPLKAYLRREINVKEPVKEAFFYAFADKRKTYYFNGKKIELKPWKKLPRTFGHVKGYGIDLTKLLTLNAIVCYVVPAIYQGNKLVVGTIVIVVILDTLCNSHTKLRCCGLAIAVAYCLNT